MPNFKFAVWKCYAVVKNTRFGQLRKLGTHYKQGFYRIYFVGRELRSLLDLHLYRIESSANPVLERFGLSFLFIESFF
jgi:hypothetical protein